MWRCLAIYVFHSSQQLYQMDSNFICFYFCFNSKDTEYLAIIQLHQLWQRYYHLLPCIKKYAAQFSSVAQSCPNLCNPMDFSTPGFPVHYQLPELTQTHVHRVSDAIQTSHPLLYPSPWAFNLSQHQGLFQWVSLWIRWPKNWGFSFSISLSNEYSVLIFFRIDWFDLLAVQGTLKSLLSLKPQFKSINFLVLSFLYSPTLTAIRDYWENHRFD